MKMISHFFKTTLLITLLSTVGILAKAQQNHRFDPPWNTPPEAGINFTVLGIDNVPDLYGDINDPQLVIFFAGNQFMVIDDLLRAFKKSYPKYHRIFAETLPPGILAQQIEKRSLVIGNLRISLQADIYTAGKARVENAKDQFSRIVPYAKNRLAIMVQQGNPLHIKSLQDLGKENVRVSMPNPKWEGIGSRIEEAYVKIGGKELKQQIMETKVKNGSTILTKIHHRQTPLNILYDLSDAGPVWVSEVHYQKMIHHPVEQLNIPDDQNVFATYAAGALKTAPHPKAASDFLTFMASPEAQAIYHHYGFLKP